MNAKTLQLGTYITARESEPSIVELSCEIMPGIKQTIFLTSFDIQKIYETFCLQDKDPLEWVKMVEPGQS